MMYMPFLYETTRRIAELEAKICHINSPIICHHKIYYNEILVRSIMGKPIYCDIILQKIPEGRSMAEIMGEYPSMAIKSMITELSLNLRQIGFAHNHLSPENIIVSYEPRMYPIRYWYATLERHSTGQDMQLYQYAMDNDYSDYIIRDKSNPLESSLPNKQEVYYEGLTHFCRHNRIGFKDMEGNEVIPPIYYDATHFFEDRAIVAKRLRQGVINKRGEIIVDIEFKNLHFDPTRHLFVGFKEGRRYTFDYNGTLVERVRCVEKIEGGGFLNPKKR
jgi:hypothetical protein